MSQGTLGIFDAGEQDFNGQPPGFVQGLVDGAQAHVVSQIQVVESQDSQVLRDAQPQRALC